ncbi:rhodanese-like domain-containing protein [Pricia sp. S334]|uniref:Rhodanese-like domain-containing protein n=1 Tax=Pricia mediterranea TaxID=3076079 RepID=A0ABU3L177_9FLAO|nr:rhodanese-like domain-containing protein [Pricia sp. S334]MDT7827479.1 rhodanese-like domain-containing protein [Pricia sp. S334]
MKDLIILLLFVSAVSCTSKDSGKVQRIDIETVKADVIGKDVQWVDVRTPQEYEAGHIDDAINIDISDSQNFKEKVEKLNKNEPVYIYCQKGGRSERAATLLKDMGFESIFDYSGGYGEWSQQ